MFFLLIPTLHRGGVSQIRVAGMDGLHRFVLLLSGSIEKNKEGVVLEQEQLGSILRFLRNPSLHWMPVLEQASGVFPQKVFCQLLILESVLKINTGKKGDTLQNLPGRPSLQRGEISSKIILSKNLQMGISL